MTNKVDTRKASDILLSIEAKLDLLVSSLQDVSFNSKLLLTKLGSSKLEETKKETPILIAARPIEIAEQPTVGSRRGSINDIIKNESKSYTAKIPVTQRVVDKIGKDLFMAEVTITDSNEQVINKIKTNAVGKWQTNLPFGKFKIKITKMERNGSRRIENEQEIELLEDMKSLQLPNFVMDM